MAFPISKTTTAVGMEKSGMTLGLTTDNEGNQNIVWAQGYQFVDMDGKPVLGLQKLSSVNGHISLADMQTNFPDLLNALTFIWNFLDNQIKQQEGL